MCVQRTDEVFNILARFCSSLVDSYSEYFVHVGMTLGLQVL